MIFSFSFQKINEFVYVLIGFKDECLQPECNTVLIQKINKIQMK